MLSTRFAVGRWQLLHRRHSLWQLLSDLSVKLMGGSLVLKVHGGVVHKRH